MLERGLFQKKHVNRNDTLFDVFMVVILGIFGASHFFSNIFEIPVLGTPATSIIRIILILFIAKKLINKEKFLFVFFPLFLLWGFNLFSILWSTEPGQIAVRSTSILQFFLIIFVTGDIVKKRIDIKIIFFIYVILSTVSMMFFFWMIVTGFRPENTSEFQTRLTVLGQDQNTLSFFYCLGLVFLRDFYNRDQESSFTKNFGFKLLSIISFLLTPIAIVSTGSRTGFVIYIFILSTFFTTKRSITLLFVSLVLIFGAMEIFGFNPLSFFDENNIERVTGAREELEEGDLTGRLEAWKASVEIIGENPFLGTGFGASSIEIGQKTGGIAIDDEGRPRMAAHNVFLQILVETGVIGFLVFLISLWYLIIPVVNFSPRK